MSIKKKIRLFITKNKLIERLYDKYHEEAKYIYQFRKPRMILNEKVKLDGFCNGIQSFFGYYDKSPERNGHYIYHVVNSRSLKLNQEIDIYYDDEKIGSTKSWNWQQGAMLSWLNDQEIIYNIFKDDGYRSCILNLDTRTTRIIDYPIYQVSTNGRFALSLNFSRLARLRPDYGYFNLPYDNIKKIDENDGIFYIDLLNNSSVLIISLSDLANMEPQDSMLDAYHKVNHIDLSPDQTKFIFLHRWFDTNNVKHSRLITYDLTNKKMKIIANEDMVSHYSWKNDHEIVAYLRHRGIDHYYLIDIETLKMTLIGNMNELNDDGHPSLTKDEQWMVTDTYPDYTCKSHLLLFNMITKKMIMLGDFYSPKRYHGINRCDLHPRWSNAKELTFDSVYQGMRRLCRIDISEIIDEGK